MGNPILGTDTVMQIGIVVHDIEKSRKVFADFFGIDPPDVFVTGAFDEAGTVYNGQPTQARAKLAFIHAGPNLDIELIEPDENPSIWRRDLDEKGEGFHHIAFSVKGMKEKIACLEDGGMSLIQAGEYTGGRYAYIDSVKALKVTLELLENDNV